MNPGLFFTLLTIVGALVMLFQLRALLQSSSADYYHPFTQAVTKLTNPLVNIGPLRHLRVGSFFVAGFVVSFVIALIFWLISAVMFGFVPPLAAFICAALMVIKNFGFLILILLFAQALTSFIPATYNLSFLFGQTTEFLTKPVRSIIPPIGVIDLSVMIVMIAIYALNALMFNMMYAISPIWGGIWKML